jgi:riboflavin synthase
VSINNFIISLDVSSETLFKSTLAKTKVGNIVHLELPVSMSKPLGGHFVTGHVDENIFIKSIEKMGEFTKYIFDGISKPEWICDKGSIALDGISLTINRLPTQTSVECMLIPHTIANTCFKSLVVNDLVNVEYDYIAKIVARQNTLKNMSVKSLYSEEV